MKQFFLPLLLFSIFLTGALAQEQASSPIQVGTAKINITPTEAVYLSGYGGMYSPRITNQVYDSLYCRATALRVKDQRVVFISSDLIGSYLYEEVYEKLDKDLALSPQEVFFTAIHTHSAPVFTLSEEDKETANYRYTLELIDKIAQVVGQALQNTQTAFMEINTGYSPIGINRRALKFHPEWWPWDGGLIKMARNPGGIVNNEVSVLKITNPESGFQTCLFEYGCHARSQSPSTKIITGDFFGLSEQKAEQILGPGTIVSGFAGASGDVDPVYVLGEIREEAHWVPEIDLMGQLLAQEIVRTYRGEQSKISGNILKSTFKTIYLPSRDKEEYISNDSLPKTPLNITVSSFGSVAFIGIGCEVLVEIGNKIKAASPFPHNIVMTHCNGGAGYLPPKELYKERGYEVSNSPFGPESAEILIREVLQLLYAQYEETSSSNEP